MGRPIVSIAIVTTLSTATPRPVLASSWAAPSASTQERSEAFVVDGDRALARGDYAEAVAKYRAAYYGLTAEQRTSYIGSIPVRNAMQAYELLLAERQDRRVLEQQLGFLAEFLESVRDRGDGVAQVGSDVIDALEETRVRAEKKLAALSQVVAPPRDPEDPAIAAGEPAPKVEPEPSPSHEPIDAGPPSRPDRLGLGLAIGGGVATGLGLGVMAGWWTVRRQAEAKADAEFGPDSGSPGRAEYLREQWYLARRYLVAGGVITGLGLATAAAGVVVILVRRGRGGGLAMLVPEVGPTGAGLRLAGRFRGWEQHR
jgi:hypothetical protein